MRRFLRVPGRAPLPDAVRALSLGRGEYVRATAATESGGHVVVTDVGLRLVGDDGRDSPVLPWVEVDRATWSAPVLRVEPAPTLDGVPREAWEIAVPDPGMVPRELRARVDATVLWSVRRPLSGAARGDVRIVARRGADGGPIRWRVWPDAGVRLQDPMVRAEIEEMVRAARVTVGDSPEGLEDL